MCFLLTSEEELDKSSSERVLIETKTPSQLKEIIETENILADSPDSVDYRNLHETETSIENEMKILMMKLSQLLSITIVYWITSYNYLKAMKRFFWIPSSSGNK